MLLRVACCAVALLTAACDRPLVKLAPLEASDSLRAVPDTVIAGVTPLHVDGGLGSERVTVSVRDVDLAFDAVTREQVLPQTTPAGLADVTVRTASGRVTRQTLLI